eukprot:1155493-Pelagomonas_calceolata.AAC.5
MYTPVCASAGAHRLVGPALQCPTVGILPHAYACITRTDAVRAHALCKAQLLRLFCATLPCKDYGHAHANAYCRGTAEVLTDRRISLPPTAAGRMCMHADTKLVSGTRM